MSGPVRARRDMTGLDVVVGDVEGVVAGEDAGDSLAEEDDVEVRRGKRKRKLGSR